MKKNLFAALLLALCLTACGSKGNGMGGSDARMELDETVWDFGTIRAQETFVYHDFTFRNTGSDKLVITGIHAYCHCTAVDYPKDPIKPGKQGTISVRLNAGDVDGYFSRMIDIYTNGQPQTVSIEVKGQKESL